MGYSDEMLGELSKWIDSDVIAEAVLDGLVEAGLEPTVGKAQMVWLNVLQNGLPDDIKYAIDAIKAGWKAD